MTEESEKDKIYSLQRDKSFKLAEMLSKNGYDVCELSGEIGCGYLIVKDSKVVGHIQDSVVVLYAKNPEGRTLDKLLAEWKPEEKR